ncbi:hypothetical protein CEXT_337901 [Caerostris extrusa]|uniref:Uncharacterized protein n=1 Tax=Caerostris extrusa TaxID=172846 RepID=A0AAV4UJT7_CAEEX|nr:hypothetical protein CEXT_337901 [Caerostris extrusa]
MILALAKGNYCSGRNVFVVLFEQEQLSVVSILDWEQNRPSKFYILMFCEQRHMQCTKTHLRVDITMDLKMELTQRIFTGEEFYDATTLTERKRAVGVNAVMAVPNSMSV